MRDCIPLSSILPNEDWRFFVPDFRDVGLIALSQDFILLSSSATNAGFMARFEENCHRDSRRASPCETTYVRKYSLNSYLEPSRMTFPLRRTVS
jgi:hypothetical protein